MSKSSAGMATLPKGFHVVENCVPSAEEVETEKKLSALADSLVALSSTATVPPADLRVRLHRAAVQLYLARGLDNPSESMDDPVIRLLEKAQSLKT
jgi:hypothetical protein